MRELFTSVRGSLLRIALLHLTQFCIKLLARHTSHLTVTNKRIKRSVKGVARVQCFEGGTREKIKERICRVALAGKRKKGEEDGNKKRRG